jgi:4-hydroxybenzoate polyprenyltransferase
VRCSFSPPLPITTQTVLALGVANIPAEQAYSAPLLRLKERPLLGPLTIALTQFALPQLLVFVLFEFYSWETLLFMALFFLAGLRGILFHQVLDYGNDLQASVRTFVTAFGVKRTWHTLTLLTAVEICMLIATLAVCNRTVSGILIYAAGLAALGLLRNRGTASLMPRPYTMLLEFYCFFGLCSCWRMAAHICTGSLSCSCCCRFCHVRGLAVWHCVRFTGTLARQ